MRTTSTTKWQRSHDAVAGGVCAGFAGRLGLDPVVVRVFAVLLCIMTLGLGVVLYLVLWALIPLEPEKNRPVDVVPREATSETYGAIDPNPCCANETAPASDRAAYAGVAHEPPTPPLGSQSVASAVAAHLAAGGSLTPGAPGALGASGALTATAHGASGALGALGAELPAEGGFAAAGATAAPATTAAAPAKATVSMSAAAVAGAPATAPAAAVAATVATTAATVPGRERSRTRLSKYVKPIVVWLCFALAFVGLMRLLGFVVQGVGWWRFWPLFFALSGIAIIAVPGKPTLRMAHAVAGWIMLVAGSVVLPMSVGLVRWASLAPWLIALWPLLVCSVVLLVLGRMRRFWPFSLLAGIAFTLFAVGGLLLYAQPGAVSSIVVDLPVGRDIVFAYPFE